MTPLDDIQDIADQLNQWLGTMGYAHELYSAVRRLRPLLNAAREIAQDGPGHWRPENIANLIEAYRKLESSNPPAENGGTDVNAD